MQASSSFLSPLKLLTSSCCKEEFVFTLRRHRRSAACSRLRRWHPDSRESSLPLSRWATRDRGSRFQLIDFRTITLQFRKRRVASERARDAEPRRGQVGPRDIAGVRAIGAASPSGSQPRLRKTWPAMGGTKRGRVWPWRLRVPANDVAGQPCLQRPQPDKSTSWSSRATLLPSASRGTCSSCSRDLFTIWTQN